MSYLVGLVVELLVVLVELCLLGVIPSLYDLVEVDRFSPCLSLDEPI